MLSFSPLCSRIRSTTSGLEYWPSSSSTGSPGPNLPRAKVMADTMRRMKGSHNMRRNIYVPNRGLYR